jgi:hypothetical protein
MVFEPCMRLQWCKHRACSPVRAECRVATPFPSKQHRAHPPESSMNRECFLDSVSSKLVPCCCRLGACSPPPPADMPAAAAAQHTTGRAALPRAQLQAIGVTPRCLNAGRTPHESAGVAFAMVHGASLLCHLYAIGSSAASPPADALVIPPRVCTPVSHAVHAAWLELWPTRPGAARACSPIACPDATRMTHSGSVRLVAWHRMLHARVRRSADSCGAKAV